MGASQPRWYQVGKRSSRPNHAAPGTGGDQGTDNPRAPQAPQGKQSTDGAMVARSQILFSGATATLLGTLTNETGCDVYFSGMPPYAVAYDADGSRPTLLGDFNSPPREQPSAGDRVMHPGASVPYRSLPVTLQNLDPPWDGTDWCTSSRATTLDIMSLRNQRELPTIQVFD